MWFGMAAAIGNAIARESFERPATLQKTCRILGFFSACGWSAASTHWFGASSIAELGAAIPRSGGQYNFSRRALGDYAGSSSDGVIGLDCGTAAAVCDCDQRIQWSPVSYSRGSGQN